MKEKADKELPFCNELLEILREDGFRDPLLPAIKNGQLGREELKRWVLQAALVVRQFTRFISAIHSNCPDRQAQQLLAENLWEEHGRGKPSIDHLALVERLARSLGASEAEINSIKPIPETVVYMNHCFKTTRESSFIESMTAIGVGIEFFMPSFFGALGIALREKFGLASADVEYLMVHVGEDEDHARRAMEIIEANADTDEKKDACRSALREMLAVKNRFATAVFKHAASGSG